MKVDIIGIETNTNSKTGEISHILKAIVPVSAFGKQTLDLISIRVDDPTKYKKGEMDLPILLPRSDYPYHLQD